MKRNIFTVIFLLIAVTALSVYSAPPTFAAIDGNYTTKGDTTIRALVGDTCGAGDSASLFTKKSFKDLTNGVQYVLLNEAIVASGDSVGLQIVIDCYVDSTVVANRVIIDTLTAESPQYTLLPFLGTVYGRKFTLKLLGISALNGTTVVLGKFHLFKRRVEQKTIGMGR